MKQRIFKSWKTSVLGVILLGFALVMVAIGKTTFESLVIFLPISFALIFTHDPRSWRSLKIVFFIVNVWLLTGCSPQARLSRLVARHPELKRNDTIKIHDTVFIPASLVDTSAKVKPGETLFINKGQLEIQIIRMPGDTIRVKGGCKADTVIKEIPVIVPRIIVQPAPPDKLSVGKILKFILWGAIGGLIVLLILEVIKFLRR